MGRRRGAGGTSTAAQTVNVTARSVTGRIYEAVWFAPEVKRAVKTVEEIYDSSGIRSEHHGGVGVLQSR